METDEAKDDEDDDWKAVMPEVCSFFSVDPLSLLKGSVKNPCSLFTQEWVPIITRDIVHQRRMHNQAPFSDAYLAGVPPKRRKVSTYCKD